MPLLTAAIAMLVTPLPAAQQWYRVNGGRQTAAYVDKSAIAIDGDLRTVSTTTVRAAPMLGSGAVSFVTKQIFRCSTGEVSDLEVTYFDEAGAVISSGPAPGGSAFKGIFEGTNVDLARKFACNGEGGTRVTDPASDSRIVFGR